MEPVVDGSLLIERAILYAEGRMWDLNTLIPRHSGWRLQSAVAINDAGQIIAVGDFQEQRYQRTCLLTPVKFRKRNSQ